MIYPIIKPAAPFLLALLLCACTSNPSVTVDKARLIDQAIATHNLTAMPDDRVTCTLENSAGTNISRTVCKTEVQLREERTRNVLFTEPTRLKALQAGQ